MKPPYYRDAVETIPEEKQCKRPRRSNKPAMERRRRERINDSLEQLKNYVLVAEGKDPARYTKVEKADILDMTVRFLRPEGKLKIPRNCVIEHSLFIEGYRKAGEDTIGLLKASSTLQPDIKSFVIQQIKLVIARNIREYNSNASSIVKSSNINSSNNETSITVSSTLSNGCTSRAKLAVKSTSALNCQTVHIPPSNTWSPPVVIHPGLESICSPPSSPETVRTDSPHQSPCSKLSTQDTFSALHSPTDLSYHQHLHENEQQPYNQCDSDWDIGQDLQLSFVRDTTNTLLYTEQVSNVLPLSQPTAAQYTQAIQHSGSCDFLESSALDLSIPKTNVGNDKNWIPPFKFTSTTNSTNNDTVTRDVKISQPSCHPFLQSERSESKAIPSQNYSNDCLNLAILKLEISDEERFAREHSHSCNGIQSHPRRTYNPASFHANKVKHEESSLDKPWRPWFERTSTQAQQLSLKSDIFESNHDAPFKKRKHIL